MKYKIETLDARHNGWSIWKYRIRLAGTMQENIRLYHKIRQWLWEVYGPGCERDFYMEWVAAAKGYELAESVWAWHTEDGSQKFLYLRDDAIMSSVIMQFDPN